MILKSVIRIYFVSFVLSGVYGQDSTLINVNKPKIKSFFFDEKRQRFGALSGSYQVPIETGNNFIGQGFKGDDGYSITLRLFPYKQFFIGYSYGLSQFDVKNRTVVGNYRSTNAEERYFLIGYEFLPLKKVRIGIYTWLGGKITLTNQIVNSSGSKDTGRLIAYGFNIDFELTRMISIYSAFTLKRMKTDISAPSVLQSQFDEGRYNTFNLGLRFSFGTEDIFSRYFK